MNNATIFDKFSKQNYHIKSNFQLNFKKIDESIVIDSELSTLFFNKSINRIHAERKIAKRLGVTYQLYFLLKNSKLILM